MPSNNIRLTVGATTRDMKLARENGPSGPCLFRSYEANQDTARPDLPIFEQTDWSRGHGEGDFKDPAKFSLGANIDTSTSGQIALGPLLTASAQHDTTSMGYATAFGLHGGTLYCASCKATVDEIFTWSTANSHWDACSAGDYAISNFVSFGGKMFAARGTTLGYGYATTTTFTTCTLTDHHANGFCVAPSLSGTCDILWKYNHTNEISSNTSGINGGAEWTTPAYIGDTNSVITNMWVHQGKLLIGKGDGLYHYDSDGAVYLLMAAPAHGLNFTFVTTLKGASYFSFGSDIGELTGNSVFSLMGPYHDLEGLTNNGYCVGLTNDGEHLYASITDGTNSYVFKGWTYVSSEGERKWAWCPIHSVASVSVGMRRLFYCDMAYTPYIWGSYALTDTSYFLLSRNYPWATAPTYATSGYLETGWIDLGHRDWYKIVDSVLAECRGTLAAGRTVTLSYYADEGSITQIDSAYTADTAGTKKYADTAPIAAKKVKFRIALASNSSAYTPIVKYFSVYGSVRPTRARLFDFTVIAEEGFSSMTLTLRDFLISGRDATSLLTLVDRFGSSHYVRILPGYPIETELVNLHGKQVGIAMRVICEKVDWS